MKKTEFLCGTVILAASALIVRLISFTYDITLSRVIGAEAIGLFYMINPILMIFLMITTTGIPTAVSRLTAKAKLKNNYYEAVITINTAISLTLIISFLLIIVLICFSEYISFSLYENKEILSLIYFIIPAIPILSLTSVLRGYLYGLNKMLKAGFSEIIEHISRFAIVMLIICYFQPLSPYNLCKAAILGISIGEFIDLIYLIFVYKNITKKTELRIYKKVQVKSILLNILYISAPLTILGFINVGSQSLSAVLIPRKLIEAGIHELQATKIFGRVMGMGLPLVYLPYIITSAIVINIIPNVSKQFQLKDYKDIKSNINISIRVTMLVTLPIMAIYILFSEPLSALLYDDVYAGEYIRIMAYSMPFLSIQHIFSGILCGIGKQVRATLNRVLGISLQIICIALLVKNPAYAINGYFLGFIASPIVVCLFDMTILHRYLRSSVADFVFLFKILAVTSVTLIFSLFYYNLFVDYGMPANSIMIFTILIYIFLYIFILILLKANPLKSKFQ